MQDTDSKAKTEASSPSVEQVPTRKRTREVREGWMRTLIEKGTAQLDVSRDDAYCSLRVAEEIAIDLEDTDTRHQIWALWGDKLVYTLDELDDLNEDVGLATLYHPFEFDAVRDNLDQRTFRSLFELHLDDPIVQCRKAELLISLDDYRAAYELLEGNSTMLARGLRAKALACMNKVAEVAALTKDFRLSSVDELALEGAVHLYEMAMWVAYVRGNYAEAYDLVIQAESIAKQLWLEGRLKTLAASKEEIASKLGLAKKPTADLPDTGNPDLASYQALVRIRHLLREADYQGAHEVAQAALGDKALANLVKATEFYHQNKLYSAAQLLHETEPSEPEFIVHQAFLRLSIFVKTADQTYANPSLAFKRLIEAFLQLRYPTDVLADARLLYPLGLSVAAKHPDLEASFQAAAALVPRLRNEKYRDGLWVDGQKLTTIPIAVRRALSQDDLEGGTKHIQAISSADKRNLKISLEQCQVQPHHFITETSLLLAFLRLDQVMPQTGWDKCVKDLLESSKKLPVLLETYGISP